MWTENSDWGTTRSGFLDVIIKVVNHLENNLAKFGYILNMKVENQNRILLCSWLPTSTYHQNLANLGHFFSMKNPLYRLKSYFFQVEIWWNFGSNETLLHDKISLSFHKLCLILILVALIWKYYYHGVKCCCCHGDLEEVSYGLSCRCVGR